MAETITYEYLWQIYQKERQSNQLSLIPKTFYEDIFEFVNKMGKNPPEEKIVTMKNNSIKLLNDLFEKRKQKILIYIAYNKTLPQPISNLETEFYNKILKEVRAERLERVEVKSNNTITLKSLKDIPKIVLPSGGQIGPLKKDQIIELKEEDQDANFLVSNAICEKV